MVPKLLIAVFVDMIRKLFIVFEYILNGDECTLSFIISYFFFFIYCTFCSTIILMAFRVSVPWVRISDMFAPSWFDLPLAIFGNIAI